MNLTALGTLRADRGESSARRFFKAPQTVLSLAAACIEPGVIVLVLYGLHLWHGLPFDRGATVAALMALMLTFPGRNRLNDSPLEAARDIVSGWAGVLAMLGLFAYATRSIDELDWNLLSQWIVATPLIHWSVVMAGRAWMLRRARLDPAVCNIVLIGGSPLGVQAAQALAAREGQRVNIVGYFDDRRGDRLHPDAAANWLGRLDEAARYVDKLGIREVYVSLPLGSQPRMARLLEELQGTTASLYFVPDVVGMNIIQGRLQDVNGLPVVGICETPFTGINALAKRLSDMLIGAAVLLLAAPLMLLIAIGVKFSSPGPVIFKQRRNGLDGEEIIVYKFRTMRATDNGPVIRQATADDARVTKLGRILRRTSLDELPQFINVLQGRMSIVGPRPHAVAHNEMYRRQIKAYMVRHKARPGITGWAQVNGLRGETDTLDKMRERVAYDLEYLRNWSLAADLRIMWRTLRLIVADPKAY
jgi:putative colanic acid biosynthesis UDP-glucose lipid carrier transferase